LRESVWNGVWWAVVTATTVGYGDITPATPPGRIIGIVLMLGGIGFVLTPAASIAAHFIGHKTSEPSTPAEPAPAVEELGALRADIARLSDQLARLEGRLVKADARGADHENL
jgi:voltage-gated potassium channel